MAMMIRTIVFESDVKKRIGEPNEEDANPKPAIRCSDSFVVAHIWDDTCGGTNKLSQACLVLVRTLPAADSRAASNQFGCDSFALLSPRTDR